MFKLNKKIIICISIFASLVGVNLVFSAPVSNIFRNILPATDDTYDLGTSTARWKNIYTDNLTVSGTYSGTMDGTFSTTSAEYWDGTKWRWATTSSAYWLTTKSTTDLTEGTNLYYTDVRDVKFSSTSAIVWLGTRSTTDLPEGTNLYYLDSKVNLYIHASSTIPKLYTDNTFTKLNIFSNATSSQFTSSDTLWVNQICYPNGQCAAKPYTVGSLISFFKHNAAMTDVSGYESLYTYPPTGTETSESCTADTDVTGGYCLIDSYVSTTTDIAILNYPAGTWKFDGWAYKGTGGGTTNVEVDVYKRNAAGTETYLFQATSSPITATAITPMNFSIAQSAIAFLPTDRLVVKYYGWTDSTNGRLVYTTYGSTVHFGQITTPATDADVGHSYTFANNIFSGSNIFSATSTHYAVLLSSGGGIKFQDGTYQHTAFTGSSGITTLNTLTAAAQTFTTPNGLISISSVTDNHAFNGSTTPTFSGLTSSSTFRVAGATYSSSTIYTDSGVQMPDGYTLKKGLLPCGGVTILNASSTPPTSIAEIRTDVPYALTIRKVSSKVSFPNGGWSANQGMTFNIRHSTDMGNSSTTATALFTNNVNSNSTTTSLSWTNGFNDATIAAGETVWIHTSVASTSQMNLIVDLMCSQD